MISLELQRMPLGVFEAASLFREEA